ncbi:MAG: hypothetical protein PHP62_05175 [Candidatus Moranbacteria bacterium]|nr:hypothetical protein [Candidatus Moranbacteria bacterium]
MKDFLSQNKIQIIIGVYVAAMIALVYFVVLPIVGDIGAQADEIQQKQLDGELNEKRLADVPTMEENYGKFKENEDRFSITIEPNSEVDLIKELETLADQTGNKIEFQIQEADSKPVAKQKGAEPNIKEKLAYNKYLSMKIAIEGNYSGLIRFIQKLENYKKTVNILAVSSEKKELAADQPMAVNPFVSTANNSQRNASGKEVINSILDVVVYIKK